MSIAISHESGPLAGQRQEIGSELGEILFGREKEAAEVVFPPQLTKVGRRHFRLVRGASGDYTVDLLGEHYVEIDGVPAERGQHVRDGALIRLGDRNGPSFRVEVRKDQAEGYLVTGEQVKPKTWRDQVRGLRLAAAGGFVVVAAVVAGLYAFVWTGQSNTLVAMAALEQRQAELAERQFSAAVVERLREAAYVVVLRDASGRETAVGTAWPVAREGAPNDVLVTNAHVAGFALEPGETMLVRSPGESPEDYAVTGHRSHAGYDAFTAFAGRDAFGADTFRAGFEESRRPSAYDVALLTVDRPVDGPALELASAEEIAGLGEATPLATAGYPVEGTLGESTAARRPTPETHFGNLTSRTNFFLLAEESGGLLLHHSLPAIGGASGSPIVNPAGHVVGVLSGGNVTEVPREEGTARAASAVLINFAQDGDLVRDLLEGSDGARLARDEGAWNAQVAMLDRMEDTKVEEFVRRLDRRHRDAARAEILSRQDRLDDASEKAGVLRRDIVRVPVEAGHTYGFIAYAENQETIALKISAGGELVAGDNGATWFPSLTYEAEADGEIELWVLGRADRDIAYSLNAYRW